MEIKDYNEIIKRAKSGDTEALEEIYKNYYAFVVFTCQPHCDNKEDIEEIVQDTFFKAFSNLKHLENDATFLAWLKRIAVNECYRKHKKSKKDKTNLVYSEEFAGLEVSELDKGFLPEEFSLNKELRTGLLSIINALPEMQKKMVHLYYYTDMNATEISKLLNCSPGNVRKALFTARNTIKTKLEDKGIYSLVLVSLGSVFAAEEAIFATEFVATNTAAIASAALTVVHEFSKQAFIAKVVTFTTVGVVTMGLALAGISYAMQPRQVYTSIDEEPYELINFAEQEEIINLVEESSDSYTTQVFEYVIEEDIPAEEPEPIYDDTEVRDDNPTIYEPETLSEEPQEETDEPQEAEEIIEQEGLEESDDLEYTSEPEIMPDKTPEILSALEVASTEESLNEIISRYNFSLFASPQSSIGEVWRFYRTDEGSGEILIGIYDFEGVWLMNFRFFEGGTINMQRADLISWMEE